MTDESTEETIPPLTQLVIDALESYTSEIDLDLSEEAVTEVVDGVVERFETTVTELVAAAVAQAVDALPEEQEEGDGDDGEGDGDGDGGDEEE